MIVRKFQCRSNWRSDEVKRGRIVSLSYEILQQVPPDPTLAPLRPPHTLVFKLFISNLAWPGARQKSPLNPHQFFCILPWQGSIWLFGWEAQDIEY